jgi:DNA-binding transcriptional LysR family regulator
VVLAGAVREPFIAYSRKDYPDYHELLASVFSATKGRLRIVEETDGGSSLISDVGAGHGVALMPESLACIAGARLKLLPLTPAPKPLSIGIVSPQTGRSIAAECFLKCAKEAVSGK